MTAQSMKSDSKVREVVAGLVQAGDAQIARVVAIVDGMPDRGEADALIAPLRSRLAQLRPARPFGFTRLLFSPLDPVIMPGLRWRRGEVGIPRAALAPIGMAVQAALPELATSLEPSACRVTPDDRAAIASLGSGLWPEAAEVLRTMSVPANWTQASGFIANDFVELAGTIAAVLREATEIETMASHRSPPGDTMIRAVLGRAEVRGGLAHATTIAILLARLAAPSRVLALASEMTVGGRNPAAESAMDHVLAGLQASAADGRDNGDLVEAAIEASRIASLLSGLEDGTAVSTERRGRLEQIRREADLLCRGRFDRAVTATMAQIAAVLNTRCDDETFTNLENTARDLRRLEAAGRRLGKPEHYDILMQTMSEQFRNPKSELDLADRVRMVEILAGPEEALTLLQSQ